jgi:hypothetical protein
MNPHVFFVGCPRSGTTLLRRIGDAHPELAIIGELHWLPRLWERRIGMTAEGIVTPEIVDTLLGDRRFRKLELAGERIAALAQDGLPKHFARFVTEVFDLHGLAKGKRYVGEKTPGYVRIIPLLDLLWPHVKVVHLIRDGRDVGLSVRDWSRVDRTVARFPTWEEHPITTAAVWWEWHVRLSREGGGLLGPYRYCELRYEALVAQPEDECRKLCAFLGLAYDPAMLRFHEGRMDARRGRSAKRSWQPVSAGLRSWREQMSTADIAAFEAASGPLLEELGYERGAPPASKEMAASAARLREAFARHARLRRKTIPRAWEGVAA